MKLVTLALVGFFLLTGCATRVAGLKQSPSFTYPAVLKGKLAVGGVASALEPLDDGKRTAFSNLLRTALLEERKQYTVSPVGRVMNQLGTAEYRGVIKELQSAGSLSDGSLRALKAAIPDTRYITFARIESDEVSTDRGESHSTDKAGKVIEGSEKIRTETSRAVTVSLHIYDLQTAEEAWSGTVTKSLANSRQYDKQRDTDLVSVIKAIKGDSQSADPYPYPPAPETHKVLASVFAGFGENLPDE